ncbi:MAG: PQQ-dependent sugar dehydrogenase [Planctomycetota bacterium]
MIHLKQPQLGFAVLLGSALLLLVIAQPNIAQETDSPTTKSESSVKGIGIEVAFPKLRFYRPVSLTHANDNRIFVVEQAGVVRVFENDDQTDRSTVFLDLTDRVNRGSNEEGLIGFAFHPNYKKNGEIYVHYSALEGASRGILSRFHVDEDNPNKVDVDSEEILLEIPQPFRNHNGGAIAFGKDGMLYLSLGDGGKANDPLLSGQDLSTLLGKILRIDVDQQDEGLAYAVPKDNPFVDRKGARPEIYALGLRNVWRFSIDRKTGDIWAGDVGQNRFDEIDLIVKGGNYGWNRWEAAESFRSETEMATEPHIKPIASYGRQWGLSVTGGNVYRGKRFPKMDGSYFYGDYISGNLWRIWKDEKGDYQNELVRRTGRSIAAFGEDSDGEVFLLSFDGKIYRIIPTKAPENFLAGWPEKLSETGIFSNMNGRQKEVAADYIPYEVNAQFWSDAARKTRYLRLPEGQSMTYSENDAWEVPVGTEIVKNFRDAYSPRMLETRVIKRTETGWEAATYVWDKKSTDAKLFPEGQQFELYSRPRGTPNRVRLWHGPSTSECASCHTDAAGYVLGLRTAQLNRGKGQSNQIARFINSGMLKGVTDQFDPQKAPAFCEPSDDTATLNDRARVVLDVNCAMCHRPNGPGNANIDLRYTTNDAETKMFDLPPAQGDLGIEEAKIVKRGDPDKSTLLKRMETLSVGRMPTIGSNLVDEDAVSLIREWIQSLED